MTEPGMRMNTALSAARTTSRWLTRWLLESEKIPDSRGFASDQEWRAIIALCNRQFITPALASALLGDETFEAAISEEVRELLELALRLNRRRNDHVIAQVTEISRALRKADIAHACLKGSAVLMGEPGLFRDSRILADIDILVDPARLPRAVELMHGLGYRYRREDEKPGHHVLPIFFHGQKLLGIELHSAIGSDPGLPRSEDLIERSGEVQLGGTKVPILDATDRMFHAFYHSQIADRRHMFGQLPLRSLIDFIGIWRSHRNEVDLARIDELAANIAASNEYQCYLLLADEFFSAGLRGDRRSFSERCYLARIKLQAWSDFLDTTVLWAVSLTVPLHWRRFARKAGAHQGGKFARLKRVSHVMRELGERRLDTVEELIESSKKLVSRYKAGF